jgi:multidrug efflux pump subunit AcrB
MTERNADLNIAGRIARYFIASKLTVLVVLLALLAGLLAIAVTPREENPQIVVPAANIIVAKPGARPAEVEELVVKPLEAILQGMRGVEHTYGMAQDSLGVVSVQFYVGEQTEESMVRLYTRIASNMDRLPPGTREPLIKAVDVDDVPIVTVSLASNAMDDTKLREIGLAVLERLRRVDDVSLSYVVGGRPRTINVWLDLARMRDNNVSLADIRRALEATNVGLPSGDLIRNGRLATVTAGGMLQNARDVGNLVVGLRTHRAVLLRDVASIVDGGGELTTTHRIAFGPAYSGTPAADAETNAVTLAIAKRRGSNAVRVAERVLAALDQARGELIPRNVLVNVTRNDGGKANAAVNLLIEHLGIAIATVVALLVAFLGWRAASIVTVTIPLILLITLTVGWIAGQTINRITLFALILSLGLLVDDSIVVIENIFRHYATGARDRVADAVRAVNEIGRPTNLATFTVMLAFLPMLFVTGMMGPYMRPIPFNVPVAMLASLAIAYTVAPWAAARWLKVHGGEAHEHAPGMLERGYAVLMRRLLESRVARYGFMVAVLALLGAVMALPAFRLVEFRMLPKNNTNTFNVTVDMPEGTAFARTDAVVRKAADVLRSHPEVTTVESSVGEPGVIDFNGLLRGAGLKSGEQVAELRVNLRDKSGRDESSIAIVEKMRAPLAALARAEGANIKLVEDPPGPPVRATLLAELYGPDYAQLRGVAEELKEQVFDRTPDVVDTDTSNTAPVAEYRIEVNRERALLAGVAPGVVAETLSAFLGGLDAGTVHIDGAREPVPIRFRVPRADRREPADLRKAFFINTAGARVPLSDIASIIEDTAPPPILHKDQRPVVYVSGEPAEGSQVYALLAMQQQLDTQGLKSGAKPEQNFMADPVPGHLTLKWDGEMKLTLDVFRDLGAAFGVAVVLIYLVLVGYYRSFSVPLVVMGAIPLTMIGVFPGHAIMGQYFTATSMIGVIALAGIVVRNSLLLIDFILDFRRAGHDLAEAVLEAGKTRMRPILLTAGAIMLGTLVMVLDPVFGGLAVSLVFGTFASTVLTLFVIPLLYFGLARRVGADGS